MTLGLLSFAVWFPLLGVLILACIPKEKRRALQWTAFSTTLIPLFTVVYLFAAFDYAGELQFAEEYTWATILANTRGEVVLSYALGLDGISLPLMMMTAFVACVTGTRFF